MQIRFSLKQLFLLLIFVFSFKPLLAQDFYGDCDIGSDDLAYLLTEWGDGPSHADLDDSGHVNSQDLAQITSQWGEVENCEGIQDLNPGAGFSEDRAELAPIGDPENSFHQTKVVAVWNVIPYQDFDRELQVGVVAFHPNGIDRVELQVDGGEPLVVRNTYLNRRTGTFEYSARLDANDFETGRIELRATAYPKTSGTPVHVPIADRGVASSSTSFSGEADGEFHQGEIEYEPGHRLWLFANPNDAIPELIYHVGLDEDPRSYANYFSSMESAWLDITQNQDDSIFRKIKIVLVDPVRPEVQEYYELPSLHYGRYPNYGFPDNVIPGRFLNQLWIEISPRSGLSRGQVILVADKRFNRWPQRGRIRPFLERVHWKNVTFDWAKIRRYEGHHHYHYLAGPLRPRSEQRHEDGSFVGHMAWFDSVSWIDSRGRAFSYDSIAHPHIWDRPGLSLMRGSYITNSRAVNLDYGFGNALLVRRCFASILSRSAFKNVQYLFNSRAKDLDGSARPNEELPPEEDLGPVRGGLSYKYESALAAQRGSVNSIIYDVEISDIEEMFHIFWPASIQTNRDTAWVNVSFRKAAEVADDFSSELFGWHRNILWRSVYLSDQALVFRDEEELYEGFRFHADKFVVQNSVLKSISRSSGNSQTPEGLLFSNTSILENGETEP